MADVTRVRTIYSDTYYVSAEHLADQRRIMLPLYTRKGERWTDTPAGERAMRLHKATMLHRENIASVA